MNPETMFTTTSHQFTDEKYFFIYFFNRHIIVFDAMERFFHFVQLVIVRCKEGFGFELTMFVNKFNDSPSDRNAIISTCSSSQFVEKYQAAVR